MPLHSRLRLALRIGMLFASTALVACSSEKPKPTAPPPRVIVTPVSQQDVPIYQECTEGSLVKRRQPMFQLDPRQAQASVEQATGNLERARAASGDWI